MTKNQLNFNEKRLVLLTLKKRSKIKLCLIFLFTIKIVLSFDPISYAAPPKATNKEEKDTSCDDIANEFDSRRLAGMYLSYSNYKKNDYQIYFGDEIKLSLENTIGQRWLVSKQENYDYDFSSLSGACKDNANQHFVVSVSENDYASTWRVLRSKNSTGNQEEIKDGDTIILQNVATSYRLHSQGCRSIQSPLEAQIAGNSGDNINQEWIVRIDSDSVSKLPLTWTIRSHFHLQHKATGWILHSTNRPLSMKSDQSEVAATVGEASSIPYSSWRAMMRKSHISRQKQIGNYPVCNADDINAVRDHSFRIIAILEKRLESVTRCLLTDRIFIRRLALKPGVVGKAVDIIKSGIGDKDLHAGYGAGKLAEYAEEHGWKALKGIGAMSVFDLISLVYVQPNVDQNFFKLYLEEIRRKNISALLKYRDIMHSSDPMLFEAGCADLEQLWVERTGAVLLKEYRNFYEALDTALNDDTTPTSKATPSIKKK